MNEYVINVDALYDEIKEYLSKYDGLTISTKNITEWNHMNFQDLLLSMRLNKFHTFGYVPGCLYDRLFVLGEKMKHMQLLILNKRVPDLMHDVIVCSEEFSNLSERIYFSGQMCSIYDMIHKYISSESDHNVMFQISNKLDDLINKMSIFENSMEPGMDRYLFRLNISRDIKFLTEYNSDYCVSKYKCLVMILYSKLNLDMIIDILEYLEEYKVIPINRRIRIIESILSKTKYHGN